MRNDLHSLIALRSLTPRAGAVFSADIAVPEHEREVRFYSHVLSTGEKPLWRENDLMNNRGLPIIGLGARSAEHAQLPLQWMPHIQVTDVAATVQRALDLGASVLMQAQTNDEASRWAVLVDPNRAAFGIIPIVPAESIPHDVDAWSDAAAPVGRIAWLDLTVPDASATRDFYQHVIGWSVQEVEMEDGKERYADYNMLGEDGNPVAGICHPRGLNARRAPPATRWNLPPVWMIYLPVSDLWESILRAKENGGTAIRTLPSADEDPEAWPYKKYSYAAIQDPVGAYFALVQA